MKVLIHQFLLALAIVQAHTNKANKPNLQIRKFISVQSGYIPNGHSNKLSDDQFNQLANHIFNQLK